MSLYKLAHCCLSAIGCGTLSLLVSASASADTLNVPENYATIQQAVDAANDGDTVLIAPGTYFEGIKLKGKAITLASRFISSADQRDVDSTVIDGTVTRDGAGSAVPRPRDYVIHVADDVGPESAIVGLTICNGDDGIACNGRIDIRNNIFRHNNDAIDYEGGSGTCRNNVFYGNFDDAVDLDLGSHVTVTDNVIRDNDDDGIEIRLHPYQGDELRIVIRNNLITGNKEDGIQIIDYPDQSPRHLRIERNVIANNAMAGIACMPNADSDEDYSGAPIPERIEVVGNTIAGNEYGVVGGANLVAANNILLANRKSAFRRLHKGSVSTHNLVWKSALDQESTISHEELRQENPGLDSEFHPSPKSAGIDRGIDFSNWKDSLVAPLPRDSYHGAAPDLGAFEYEAP